MPSRRRFLAALGAAGTSAVAGCLGREETTTGVVFRRRVSVQLDTSDGATWTDLLAVLYDSDEESVYANYDPEYASFDGDSATASVVGHDRLTSEFLGVEYDVGIDPTESRVVNAGVNREDFERVSLAGDAAFTTYTAESGRGYVDVRDATPREWVPERTDVHTFDVDEFRA